jgi:hypothetical protein
MRFKQNLPVCEILLHKSLSDVLSTSPNLKDTQNSKETRLFYPKRGYKCSIQVDRLSSLGPNLLAAIFKDTRLSLLTRSIEAGGFGVASGSSTILCSKNGHPLSLEAHDKPHMGVPTAFRRSMEEPVIVLKMRSSVSKGCRMMDQVLTGEELVDNYDYDVEGAYWREVSKKWQNFQLDLASPVEQLTEACDSTSREIQGYQCSKALEPVIRAAMAKSTCLDCTHIHYGLVSRLGEAEPANNMTTIEDVIRSGRRATRDNKLITL